MTSTPARLLRTDSPIGRLELEGDGTALTALTIERAGRLPHDDLPERPDAVLQEAARQLGEYFAGERQAFDLPLRLAGTDFQRAVWERIAALPWGDCTTYGAIARSLGLPAAGARAVGAAVGSNPAPIVVGCHRVLGAAGRVTGYSGGEGVPTKLWLLGHEGIMLAA